MKYKNLNTEYDQVVILDFLSKQERTKHKITLELETLFNANKMGIRPVYLENIAGLKDTLNDLIKAAKVDMRFMIHFIAHGNESGVGFKHTGGFLAWSDLETYLTELNTVSKNTLVLNMTTCFGLHGIKIVNPFSSNKPFFGLIGYKKEMNISVGKKANNIFYNAVFKGNAFNEALSEVRKQLNDENFYCITSQGYSNFQIKSTIQKKAGSHSQPTNGL